MNTTNASATADWAGSPYSPWEQALLWLVVIVLSVETIVGNAMVVIAYRIDRAISKQISNRYIVSLAVSDLIIGVEGFPLFTVYVANGDRWPLGSMACETWLFLDYTLCLVSILTVLLITVDRYMSVCHTASYLKWQSPTKTQWMIIMSWLLPAVVFGIMIYGWSAMTGEARENDSTECAAPFLANPYVNMSMYLAYYWTTLVAMLLLYKGIHKAARHLEKRADAKEKRNIALILSQRLGTQVGVTLVLQSHASPPSLAMDENNEQTVAMVDDNLLKDSGYTTLTTGLSTTAAHQAANVVYEETLEEMDVARMPRELPKGDDDDARSPVSHADQDVSTTKSPNGSIAYGSCTSRNTINDSETHQKTLNAVVHSSEGSLDYTAADAASLLEAFMDDSFSSVLQLRGRADLSSPTQSLFSLSDVLASDATSEIVRQSIRRRQQQSSIKQPTAHKSSVKFSPVLNDCRKKRLPAVEQPLIEQHPVRIVRKQSRKGRKGESWAATMRRMVASALTIKPLRQPRTSAGRSNTSSTSSTDSSHPCNRQQIVKITDSKSEQRINRPPQPPVLMVTSAQDNDSMQEIAELPGDQIDSFLSPESLEVGGHKNVTRKISSLSATANQTKQRMIATIYSPFAAIQRRRKKTKAERRAQKAFRTITFIVGFFALLWSPYYIVATIYGFCKEGCIPSVIYTISYYMCYLNSSGNPFAYALANRQFRMAFYRILRGNFSRNR